ncbi:hypothetical protein BJ742DRAFT_736592 [Cladochytrium replicatum]|nr:hypothetical protein BJ742DRAFT_736592 [Cladochytrium replicatum]
MSTSCVPRSRVHESQIDVEMGNVRSAVVEPMRRQDAKGTDGKSTKSSGLRKKQDIRKLVAANKVVIGEPVQGTFRDYFKEEEVTPSTVWKVSVKEHGFKLHLSADSEGFQQLVSVILHVRASNHIYSYPRQVPFLRLEKVKDLSDHQLNSQKAMLVSTATASKGQEMIFTLERLIRERLTQRNSAIHEEKREEEERIKEELHKAEIDTEAEQLERKREVEDELSKDISSLLFLASEDLQTQLGRLSSTTLRSYSHTKGVTLRTIENTHLLIFSSQDSYQFYLAKPQWITLDGLVEVMKELYHPNIQSVYDAIVQRVSNSGVVIQLPMEFLQRRKHAIFVAKIRGVIRCIPEVRTVTRSGVHFLHPLEKSHNETDTYTTQDLKIVEATSQAHLLSSDEVFTSGESSKQGGRKILCSYENSIGRNSSHRILREVQKISRLQHSFVVRYYRAWLEEVDGSPTQMDIDSSDEEADGISEVEDDD